MHVGINIYGWAKEIGRIHKMWYVVSNSPPAKMASRKSGRNGNKSHNKETWESVLRQFEMFSFRKKSDKVRKELEEAARESGSRSSGSGSSEDKILDSMPYFATILPNKVALRFVSNKTKF